jgi:NAD(P)-dependent dehydrogenase (short-subunit alcohol dehydrogenase family)
MNIKGKAALVTGGAVRIGRAVCRRLAAEGADVVIHYRRSGEDADALRRELEDGGVRAHTVQADLTAETACAHLIRDAADRAGRLDILVNSAAVFNKDTLRETTAEKLLDEFWPNLFAPILLIKAFAARGGPGKVVNFLDRRITADDTGCVPYLLSKKGLAAVTRLAALEWAPSVAVNAVAPGAILPPPGESMQYLQERAGPVPLRRQCTEEEIADAVLFLLRNDALTGQVVYVDGGQHLLGQGGFE